MELQKLYVTLAMEMKEYSAGLDEAANRARSFGDRIKSGIGGAVATAGVAAVAGLAAVGGGVVALGASSVGVASEFQSSMAIMSTAVDPVSVGVTSTAEAMDILSDAALAVGSDTALVGVSASSSAEAMTGLYKAGLSTGEIFGDLQGYLAGTAELGGALRASVDLAAASELDMVQASELAAVTLATFGGAMETEAERSEFINAAMNNFVQTADASVASVQGLADAFVNFGPTAASFGIPMEDVNTALGILSTRGIQGAEAGTQLKSMFLNMMNAPGAADALSDLGVALYDANGQMYPMVDIIGSLQTAMSGLTEEQQNTYAKMLAGSFGISGFNALLGEGVEGWNAMKEATAGAATMQETAAARTNTLAGAQEALSGVWETFQIKVGTALVPVLTSLANVGSTLLEKYGPTLVAVFDNVGAGIGRIVEVVSNGQLGELFVIFEDGSSVLGSLFEAFGMGEEQANGLAAGISAIVSSVQTVLEPIVAAVTNFVSFKDVLIALGIFITGTLLVAIGSLVLAAAPILLVVGALIAVVALLRNAWENNWGGIQQKVGAVVTWLQTTIQSVVGAVIAWWNAAWPTIQATIQTVWGIVQTVIQTAIDIIRPALTALVENGKSAMGGLSNLVEPLQGLWAKIGPFVQAAATVIGGILTGLLGLIVGIVKGISEAIGPLIDTFINLAENVIEIVGGIIEFFTGFFNLLIGLVTGNSELIQKAWTQMTEGITSVVTGLVTGVVELFTGLWETLKALVSGIVDGVVEFFTDLWDKLVGHSIVVDIVEDVVQWFDDMLDMLVEVLKNLWDRVSQPFIEMWTNLTTWFAEKIEAMKGIGQAIIDGLIAGIEAAKERLRGILQGVANLIPDWLASFLGIRSPAAELVPVGDAVVMGIIQGIREARDELQDEMEDVAALIMEMLDLGELQVRFEVAATASDIAGGFADRFEAQTLDPLQQTVDGLSETIAAVGPIFKNLSGTEFVDDGSVATLNRLYKVMGTLQSRINDYRARGVDESAFLYELQSLNTVNEAIDAFRLRNDVNAEYVAQQEKLLALQKAQADLDYLRNQYDMIQFITEKAHLLPQDLLAGLRFGLEADPAVLMGVMADIMEIVVRDANWRFNQIDYGGDDRSTPPTLKTPTPGTGGTTSMTVQTQNINGGQHIYLYDTEESELERLGVLSR